MRKTAQGQSQAMWPEELHMGQSDAECLVEELLVDSLPTCGQDFHKKSMWT